MELVIVPQVQGSSSACGSGAWGRSELSPEQPEGAGSTEPSRQQSTASPVAPGQACCFGWEYVINFYTFPCKPSTLFMMS